LTLTKKSVRAIRNFTDKIQLSSEIDFDGISVVIPCYNESGAISNLMSEIDTAMQRLPNLVPWECLWIDDGSKDETWQVIKTQSSIRKHLSHKGIRFQFNSGQTTAIAAGIERAKYSWIVTLDADGQNDPADIPMLLTNLKTDRDVVCGTRYDRKDSFVKRKLPSRIANKIARLLFKISISDLGCTLRVFNKKLLRGIVLSGEMHRTLTIYLKINGGIIIERAVNHRPRRHGESKYGSERILKFFCDLLLAKTFRSLYKSPIYLFSGIGLVFSMLVSSLMVAIMYFPVKFVLAMSCLTLLILIGTLFVFLGLLAQMLLNLSIEAKKIDRYIERDSFGVVN
jgi:glycosyltransferase involved in cell wall biosynthesis